MSEEQKPETPEQEPVKQEEVVEKQEPVVDDRPAENYRAELERKNRELERLRAEMYSRENQPKQRDPNDITTWSDLELKALRKDPQYAQYHDKAEEVLLERKLEAKLAQKAEVEKRVSAEMQLREKFPDALDPTSDFAMRLDKVMHEYDLGKTPAGRLAAAKLVAAELGQGKNTSDAKKAKAEQDRVARVKGQMVDGDRPKPTEGAENLERKQKSLAEKLRSGKIENQVDALSDILKDRFGSADQFFGRK